MSYGWWFLVILVTSLATFWIANRVMRPKRIPLARLADPAPLPYELPRAGLLPYDRTYGGKVHDIHGGPGQDCWCGYVGHDPGPYGPFPVDTGPLLILKAAANVALEREIEQRCAEAEAKIPPRWR